MGVNTRSERLYEHALEQAHRLGNDTVDTHSRRKGRPGGEPDAAVPYGERPRRQVLRDEAQEPWWTELGFDSPQHALETWKFQATAPHGQEPEEIKE